MLHGPLLCIVKNETLNGGVCQTIDPLVIHVA